MNPHHIVASIVHLLLTGVSVYVVAKLLPGIRARSFGSAIAFAFVVALINAVLWTLFAPSAFLYKGLSSLIVNGLVFLAAGRVVEGVRISGCIAAFFASIAVTFLNGILHEVLFGHGARWF